MEVNQLRVLREVADHGSITGAAEALFVSPSAVSQQIAALQRTVTVPLTRRNGRNLELTNAGRILAESTGAIISALDAARAAIHDYQHDTAQKVTLSAFHSAAQTFLAPLLVNLIDAWGEDAPQIECFDHDVRQEDFIPLTGTFDLVLAHRMTHAPVWPAGRVAMVSLLTEPFDVVLAERHPLAGSQLSLDDLLPLRWVVSKQGYSPFDMLTSIYAGMGETPVVVHRINDYVTAAQIVAVSNVATLVPRYTAGIAHIPGVSQVPLEGFTVARTIDVLARPEMLHRRAVVEVIDALRGVATYT